MVKYIHVLFDLRLFITHNCTSERLKPNYKIQCKYHAKESMIQQKRQKQIKINNSSCITQEQKVYAKVGSASPSDQDFLTNGQRTVQVFQMALLLLN